MMNLSSSSSNNNNNNNIGQSFISYLNKYYPQDRNNERNEELMSLATTLNNDGKVEFDDENPEPDFDNTDFEDAPFKNCAYFYSLCFTMFKRDVVKFRQLLLLYDLHVVWRTIEDVFLIALFEKNQEFVDIIRRNKDMFSSDDDGYIGNEVSFLNYLVDNLLFPIAKKRDEIIDLFGFALQNIELKSDDDFDALENHIDESIQDNILYRKLNNLIERKRKMH